MRCHLQSIFVGLYLLVLQALPASAGEALVAVATNFQRTAEILAQDFENGSDHTITLIPGSTGKLYAQIRHGAPYDIFLAADQARPALLEESPYGVRGSRFTYAQGALALIHKDNKTVDAHILKDEDIHHIAMAHPDLAPYGQAAKDSLVKLGLWDEVSSKIVTGENVGQAYTLIHSRNAELGFVALSAAKNRENSYWQVPEHLHTPIKQDAILLTKGADNPAAQSFMIYLRGPTARAIIAQAGYSVDDDG